MTKLTRRSVFAAVGIGSAIAGCATHAADTDQTSASTDSDSNQTETSTVGFTDPATIPDPSKLIVIRNESDEAWRVSVQVVREATSETVYDQTHTVTDGRRTAVYNLEDANPDGVESITVCAELLNADQTTNGTTTTNNATRTSTPRTEETKCMTTKTSKCHGDVNVVIDEAEKLNVTYMVCN
jgi:hypothetical protein